MQQPQETNTNSPVLERGRARARQGWKTSLTSKIIRLGELGKSEDSVLNSVSFALDFLVKILAPPFISSVFLSKWFSVCLCPLNCKMRMIIELASEACYDV